MQYHSCNSNQGYCHLLPIESCFPQICTELSRHNQLVIQAPPGAGKSTWLPLQLLKDNLVKGKILLLEPRRVAARNIANFLASQLNEKVGQQIGVRMRGLSQTSEQTKLEVVTEGVLTRMLQSDPELMGYDLILFDEFHERSLQADLAFALAYEVQQGLRDDLTLVIMSATLDLALLEQALPDANVVKSEGRMFEVATEYRPVDVKRAVTPREKNLHTLSVIRQALTHDGDILVFLAGIADINRLSELLTDVLTSDITVLTLHGQLSLTEQQKVLSPTNDSQCSRRIILATNIAETSLTIPGIRIVVDTGLHRRVSFDHKTGFSSLFTERISMASAEQRKGRAGRLDTGVCYRLWSESEHERLRPQYPAEIETADIAPVLMELAAWGAQSFDELNLPTQPTTTQVIRAKASLVTAGLLIDKANWQLTELGRSVMSSGLPYQVALCKQADNSDCAVLAAWLFEGMPNQARYNWQLNDVIANTLSQNSNLKNTLKRWKVKANSFDVTSCLPVLAELFPMRLAQRKGSRYTLASGSGVKFNDPLEQTKLPDYLIVLDASFSQHLSEGVIRAAVPITAEQVTELFASQITIATTTELQGKSGELSFIEQQQIGSLLISSSKLNKAPSKQQKTSAWLNLIEQQGFGDFKQVEALNILIAKLALANLLEPALFNRQINEAELRENASQWFEFYLADINSLQQLYILDLVKCVLHSLEYEQQTWLQENLPDKWQAADGTNCRLDYLYQAGVKVSVRIQSCYGLAVHPSIANGRIPLTLDLLSPARRPMQTTQDIVGFWVGSYKEVQKDMKSRYPKHYWPDDPQNAEAGTQTKRQRNV